MALFSNTARAHQMGKTRDWVVLYYDGRDGEQQCTVITSQRGPLTRGYSSRTGKRMFGVLSAGKNSQCADG